MNNDLEERYLSVIEDNVNVGKTSDLKEFGILVSGLIGLCVAIYLGAGLIANIWIDNMAIATQVKIENFLGHLNPRPDKQDKHEKLVFLDTVKPKIIAMDKKLQGKSTFPLYEFENSEVNAFITPDGSIYFTSGLLKEMPDNETLTFVLAHEMAHYAHRDHLKSIGRELIAGVVLTALTAGQADISNVVSSVSLVSANKYSQHQEKKADLYAGRVVKNLYGSTEGAIKFFEYLRKKEGVSEFEYYFSTHPAPSERINLLRKLR